LALVSFLVPQASAQIIAPEGKSKLVLDFEDASIWQSENNNPFDARAEHVSEGKKSLRVQFTNKPEWSNVWSEKLPVTDWSGYRYLNLNVFLEGDDPADFGMWARDKGQHKAEEAWPLGPGWNTVTLDLAALKKSAGLDAAHIEAICLYKDPKAKAEIVCHIDNMYLSENKPVPPKVDPVRMPDGNILANGDFEILGKADSLGSRFSSWTAKRWSGPSFVATATKGAYAGKSALLLDGRGPCKIGLFSPAIKIKSPTKLKLSAMVATVDLKSGTYNQTAVLTVTDNGERDLANAHLVIPAGSSDWKKIDLVFDVPARTPVVKVFIQLMGAGRLYIDDVTLTGVDLATANGQQSMDTDKKLIDEGPIVTESPELAASKAKALEAVDALKATIAEAKSRRLETRYAEIPVVLANLAFNIRWDLPDHLALRQGYCDFILQRATAAEENLKAVMAGKAPDLEVPANPDFAKLHLAGPYFADESGQPHLLLSMQYHSGGELMKWFCPESYYAEVSAVGATRYDFKSTPIWAVYQKHPETHRVYDGGWCGHIIRDQYSAGGSDLCVISLESPLMRQAIAKTIEKKSADVKRRAQYNKVRFINMDFEFAYRNYDPISLKMFRDYLSEKYGDIGKLNAIWKTHHKSFDDVPLPPYITSEEPQNPATWYDWGDFNLNRFTDYLHWASSEIKKDLPGQLTTTGGGNPFGSGFWSEGIDEEGLGNGVVDLWLSETGSRALGVTSVMDLQRSLDPNKPILDPEYHAMPNTCMLMFLHGCGIMDYWWWPAQPGEFYGSSMAHSPSRTLLGVETVMKAGLDVRRLPSEIASFRKAPTEIALLYSRASLIQKFPASEGNKTPYSLEMEKNYSSLVRLDTGVGFVSSKQVLAGKLEKFKTLVIPGARFVKEDVFNQILDYAKNGGTVVITPTSLIADEYNRKRNYLEQLGLTITAEELPELMAGPAARGVDLPAGEMDFIQGPVARTIVAKEPKRTLTATSQGRSFGLPATFAGEGVLQNVTPSKDWSPLATYQGASGGDNGAILVRSLGKGQVYYLAAQLSLDDRKTFYDHLMTARSFTRPIRALSPDGSLPEQVESRSVEQNGAYLTYLHNFSTKPQSIKLVMEKAAAKIENLSSGTESTAEMTIRPYETRILRIEK
jgi:beta-galactosidase GanA